jgi:hypothetical protein
MNKQQQQRRQQRRPGRTQPGHAAPKRNRGRVAGARRSSRVPLIGIVIVLVIGIAAVAAVASGGHSAASDQLASPALVRRVSSVPTSVFDTVGIGTAGPPPSPVTAPPLTIDGKPEVLYMGAEYCPYCATERWPMVIALSRFGTFSALKTTHSSSTDVFAATQTFSFHGATYQSPYLAFTGVEMQSNQRQGDGYATLDTPTAAEQQLLDTYDRAPYLGTSASSSGGIPFIDFGGKFLSGGATYDPSVLQGKSADQIADALTDPTSKIAQGAIGAANTFTAAICSLTHDQPASVCMDPAITGIGASK